MLTLTPRLQFVLTYPATPFVDAQSVDQQGSDILWQAPVDLQRHHFYLAFDIHQEIRFKKLTSKNLNSTPAEDCRPYKKPYNTVQ